MSTAPTAAPDAPTAGRWPGDDFASRLPPMLVKELRQGVQSGGFFWTFLVLQAAACVLFSLRVLAGDTETGAERTFMTFFWLAAVAAVAGIVPLRGLGAIDGERRGNTLDLLQLSRLSATRIVLGKWTALVAQAALVAVALLPYLVLRYYLGGVDVLADLRSLGWTLVAAAILGAAALALSTLPVWLRIGIAVATGGLGIVIVANGPLENLVRPFISGRGLPAEMQAGILTTVAVYTIACLQFAAGRIAPAAENHALRRRLLALVVAAAWPVAGWLGALQATRATFLLTAPLLIGSAVGAILEKPSRVRTLFATFRRAGGLGRAAAAVFAPGWASGLVFVAVLAAICLAGWLGLMERERLPGTDEGPVFSAFAALLVAAFLFPLPFTALLTRVRKPLLLYGLVQLTCFAVFAVANGCKRPDLPWSDHAVGRLVTLPFPLGAAAAYLAAGSRDANVARDLAPTYTLAGLGVIAAVLAVMVRPWLRELVAAGRLVRGEAATLPRVAGSAVGLPRPAAADRPRAWRGDDFPAWLAPMLVRELRQGVQSGAFAWTFIGIQGAMFVLMTWALGRVHHVGQQAFATTVAAFFWAAVAAAIVVVVPLRGLTTVGAERATNNLDLVRLTRLSATRIVVGKWLALVGQGLLVATAILPYLVLRYFFGGLNILADLEIFGWMVVVSMAVAAAAIAVSTLPFGHRIGVVLVAVTVGFVPAATLFEEWSRGRLGSGSLGLTGRLGLLAAVAFGTAAALEYAAARIAPPAENHAGRQRLIALMIAAAWATAGLFGRHNSFFLAALLAGPLLLCYAIGALVEQPVPIVTLYRPFRRWGLAGRLAAAVFTPGWATAVPFVAILAGLCMTGWLATWARFDPGHFPAVLTFGCQVLAAVVFPLPLLVWWPRPRRRLAVYAAVQAACALVFVFVATIAVGGVSWRTAPGWLFTLPFPLASLTAFFAMNGPYDFATAFLAAAAVSTCVVLVLVARPWAAEMRRVMRLVRGASARPSG